MAIINSSVANPIVGIEGTPLSGYLKLIPRFTSPTYTTPVQRLFVDGFFTDNLPLEIPDGGYCVSFYIGDPNKYRSTPATCDWLWEASGTTELAVLPELLITPFGYRQLVTNLAGATAEYQAARETLGLASLSAGEEEVELAMATVMEGAKQKLATNLCCPSADVLSISSTDLRIKAEKFTNQEISQLMTLMETVATDANLTDQPLPVVVQPTTTGEESECGLPAC